MVKRNLEVNEVVKSEGNNMEITAKTEKSSLPVSTRKINTLAVSYTAKAGNGVATVSLVNTPKNGARLTLDRKKLEHLLGYTEDKAIVIGLDEENNLVLQLSEGGIFPRDYKGKLIVYNKELVALLTEALSLDFSLKTTYSAFKETVELQEDDTKIIVIKKDDFM